jgi:hypothetical protein
VPNCGRIGDSSGVDFTATSRQVSEAKLIWRTSVTLRYVEIVALLCMAPAASSRTTAEQGMEPPLAKVRSRTLADRDLPTQRTPRPAHRLHLEMAVVSGTRWAPDVILDAARRAVAILGQCDIEASLVQLHEFTGPQRYRYILTPDSREYAPFAGAMQQHLCDRAGEWAPTLRNARTISFDRTSRPR